MNTKTMWTTGTPSGTSDVSWGCAVSKCPDEKLDFYKLGDSVVWQVSGAGYGLDRMPQKLDCHHHDFCRKPSASIECDRLFDARWSESNVCEGEMRNHMSGGRDVLPRTWSTSELW